MSKDEAKPESPDNTRFGRIHKKRQANRGVQVIPVKEWDTEDEPCILYAYPLTMNDVIALDSFPSAAEQNVMQIIRQCVDSKGDPYFTLLDKPSLLNEPADLIGTLLIKLNASHTSFDKELKKNNE